MDGWHDLANPAAILGVTGTLGIVASAWPASRRGIAPLCLLALGLATWSWSDAAADVGVRDVLPQSDSIKPS